MSDWRKSPPGRMLQESLLGRDFVEFSSHSLSRMRERGIAEEDVIAAIENPTRRNLPTQEGRRRVRKNRSSTTAVDVVYIVDDDRISVITAMLITIPRKKS